jgi:hypothetical protein
LASIRVTCGCESSITVKHPDPQPIAAAWLQAHPCDRRNGSDRDVTGGGQVEATYAERPPHRHRSRHPRGRAVALPQPAARRLPGRRVTAFAILGIITAVTTAMWLDDRADNHEEARR